MNFLFVVQGEGRGHLTQSISLCELLNRNGHEVVAVLAGKSNRRELPFFFTEKFGNKIRHFDSPNFLPASKNHKTNIWASIAYNVLRLWKYQRSILLIRKSINSRNVDVVVNFYELLTGLSYAVLPPKKPCFCIAHQYLFLHPDFNFPPANPIELGMLKFFTKVTCLNAERLLALSIKRMNDVPKKRLAVVPPLLRKEIFSAGVSDGDYLNGYILNDNYADEIILFHKQHPEVAMHFFWDRKDAAEETVIDGNLTFHRLNDKLFIEYMSGCRAYATTAGFESVCEAMYMGKPVLTVPTHIEQECNAFEVSAVGAGVSAHNFEIEKLFNFIPEYSKDNGFCEWVEMADRYFLKVLTQS
ncbi:MAG: glycosyltransferase [Dysgonamonadaceae bacterium]|jgi:uncharacterized protein (TIGR00661 family)|nr:glycosyltransferase [Dysgonamonadaceae bacterium]